MPAPSRRAVLAGAAAGLAAGALAGCTPQAAPPPPAPVDPDDALRAAAVDRERALLAAYDAVLAAGGDARLAVLREEHAVHLAALLGAPTTASATATPTPSPTLTPTPAVSPSGPLPDLRALERDAAAAHTAAVATASRPLAGLLAQLAASEAAHLLAL